MADVLDPVDVAVVCGLDEAPARDPAVAGSKAACLAAARGRDLPVVDGFVVTTRLHRDFLAREGTIPPETRSTLLESWRRLSRDGAVPVVVRSSSTVEDVAASSMAGRFRTVLDVRTGDGFLAAVRTVLTSADEVAAGTGDVGPNPMAVLVQQQVAPPRSGVMFGVDPVTGDDRHIVVEAVSGGPDKLVSGRVTAQHYVMTRKGRLLELDQRPVRLVGARHHAQRLLHTADLVALARLAHDTEKVFGAAQDVEWAFDETDSLLLLQSRPVTATGTVAPTHGPVLGPGPLAETFPDPLSLLEADLWIRPLRAAVRDAMDRTAAGPAHRLEESPVVTTVRGRAAADLELFGYVRSRPAMGPLDPRPGLRHLKAAWRTGVLRADLPAQSVALVAEVDDWLSGVDPIQVADEALPALLRRSGEVLTSLHTAEMLAGTLLPPAEATANALAIRVLADADPRRSQAELVHRHPVLLSLVPPSVTAPLVLPRVTSGDRPLVAGRLGPREQLRLRIRWVQEMTVRVARELARRMVVARLLDQADDVVLFTLAELGDLVRSGARPDVEDLAARRTLDLAAAFTPPLPREFRIAADGTVVPVARRGSRPAAGVAAGGGRGVGPARHGSVRQPPSPGDVLVVRDLQPGLAAWLPGLAGLVAESGGALSHLAILAREYGVPTVVAVHEALTRFPEGTRLLVDGATGEVRPVGGEEEP